MHMRTTLDLPDALLRQLKSRAALEGTTLKALVGRLIERGLHAPEDQTPVRAPSVPGLPTIRLGRPMNLPQPSNAALFELLDD